jgi:hypothetical protein
MNIGRVNIPAMASAFLLAAALALGMGLAAPQSVNSPQSSQPPLRLSPAELDMYRHAVTLIDWTPQKIKSVPFLRKLRPAESQDKLAEILNRVGETAVALFHDFAKIDCDERVYSETSWINRDTRSIGMSRKSTIRNLRYIIVPNPVGDILAFDEYRTDRSGKLLDEADLTGPKKMITSNFALSWPYFSPADQRDNRYRYFGTQSLQKRECYVVGFAQKPGVAHSVSGFRQDDRFAALLVQGIAWVDERTFQIPRIRTWLLAPRTDIGLEVEDTLVDYSPIQPAGYGRALWLPHDVTVTILFRRAYFRNTHRYSNFRLFRVESTIKPVE